MRNNFISERLWIRSEFKYELAGARALIILNCSETLKFQLVHVLKRMFTFLTNLSLTEHNANKLIQCIRTEKLPPGRIH